MTLTGESRAALAVVLAVSLACSPARALVALNDGRDRINVSGSVSVGHDSNVFAASDSRGDYVYSTTLAADYVRRAGWIGVNGSVGVTSSHFAEIDGQDFANPRLSLQFTKQTGRTTGVVSLSAARDSRADAAVNMRTESWVYGAGVELRYPVSGTFTLAGNFGYDGTFYTNSPVFSDLETYHASVDLFHIFTSERDLFGGYRYRHGETSRTTSYTDHSFSVGISGKVFRAINGSMRVGYQFRNPHGGVESSQFSSWTASGTASYAIGKRLNLNASLAKDFSTTATESFVDTLTASLDFQYTHSARWLFNAGASIGDSRFLGQGGRLILAAGPPPVLGPQRHDTYLTWNAALSYSLNDHLKVFFTYSWFENWSTSTFADFERTSYTLNVSTRW